MLPMQKNKNLDVQMLLLKEVLEFWFDLFDFGVGLLTNESKVYSFYGLYVPV